ncbi:FAD-dependent oxidoreductase [bacterium]|nr:FAD-dependent oxidoreductase [bacterium]
MVEYTRRSFLQTGTALAAGSTLISAKQANAKSNAIQEDGREVPITGKADVIVCGGGPAGIAAALAAARTGADVQIIESQGSLGGIWTVGLLCWILDTRDKYGIMQEIIKKVTARDAGYVHPIRQSVLAYDPEIMKLMLEEMCLAEGIRLRYHTLIADAVKDDNNQLTHVITESKSGREAWTAKVFIDTTGDGDVAARAGCGFDLGRAGDGKMQPMSMFALLTGLDPQDTKEFYLANDSSPSSHKKRLFDEMQKAGVTPSYTKPTLFLIRDDLYVLATNHEYGFSAINADDITQATLNARAEIHKIVNALKSQKGRWEHMRIVATNEHIGVREGRRIHGLYTVTKDDLQKGARFDDAVARVYFGVDVHALSKSKDHGSGGIMNTGASRKPYDIPLRSLIAKDVNGLLMAGRNISGDFIAHSSYRVTGVSVQLGQAAGVLAAVAAQKNQQPHTVGWKEVEPALNQFKTG